MVLLVVQWDHVNVTVASTSDIRNQYKRKDSLSVSGMEMMTPFPVPTHRRFPPIRRAVMRTKEKPSLPVPANAQESTRSHNRHVQTTARTLKLAPCAANLHLTEHLADIRLDVNVLEVLVCVRMVEAQGGVEPDGHPHAVADPRQLPHLALSARMGVEGLLQGWEPAESVKDDAPAVWSGRRRLGRLGLTSICMLLGWMTWILFL